MCMSPHEMTTARIEQYLAEMREWVEEGDNYWAWRADEMEKILKERAEAGTY